MTVIGEPPVCTPTVWLPKPRLAGTLSPLGGGGVVVPVPLTGIDCGLPLPFELTLRLALRAPFAAGLNATVTVQLPPAFTVAQPLPVIGNSVGELDVMLEIATAVPEPFVIVRFAPAVCTPTVCEPKLCAPGIVSVPVGGGPPEPPVPLTANDCGLPMPLLTMLICPLRVPVAAGVNWTLTEHEPVGGSTNAFAVHVVLVITNSSGLLLDAVCVSWTAALPVIVTLRAWIALPTPTACEPKLIAAGITSEADAPPANVCR